MNHWRHNLRKWQNWNQCCIYAFILFLSVSKYRLFLATDLSRRPPRVINRKKLHLFQKNLPSLAHSRAWVKTGAVKQFVYLAALYCWESKFLCFAVLRKNNLVKSIRDPICSRRLDFLSNSVLYFVLFATNLVTYFSRGSFALIHYQAF